jgi:hypothetical protein
MKAESMDFLAVPPIIRPDEAIFAENAVKSDTAWSPCRL